MEFDLKKYLPNYYEKSKVMDDLFTAANIEMEQLSSKAEKLKDDISFSSTTDFDVVKRYEEMFGVDNLDEYDISLRKKRIETKIKSIYSTCTEARVLELIKKFVADVNPEIEYDYPNYEFSVDLKKPLGGSASLSTLKNAIYETIPAHMKMTFVYNYVIWDSLKTNTWSQLASGQRTWEDIAVE